MATSSIDEHQHVFGPTQWATSAAIALIWGSSFLWIAIAIDDVASPIVPLTRCLFGVAALCCIPAARRRVDRSHLMRFAITGLFWMAIPFLLYPVAERSVDSSIAGMINGGLPIVTTVVTACFTRTMPSIRRMSAVAIGAVGIGVISLSSVGDDKGADTTGIALLLCALVLYAAAANIARPLQTTYGALPAILWITVFGAIWSLPFGLFAIADSHFTAAAVGSLFVLGFVGTGIAFAMFSVLTYRAGPVRGMIGIFFTPIVGLVLGVTVRHDRFHLIAVVGMILVVLGAILTSRPEPNRVVQPPLVAATD